MMQNSAVLKSASNDDARHLRFISEKVTSAALWEITSLLMSAPHYEQLALSALKSILVPAVQNRQYMLVSLDHQPQHEIKPAAVILWASVSDAIDAQIRANPSSGFRLDQAQRISGTHHWLTDAVGDENAVRAAIAKLKSELSPRGPIHTLLRAGDGLLAVSEV
jgi:hemolysin-activating ACP:hemolysin acyltransferase